MFVKHCSCIAVTTALVYFLFSQLDMAQGATPGTAKWNPTSYSTVGKVSGSPAISADGQTIYITSSTAQNGTPDGKLHAIIASSGQKAAGKWPTNIGNIASYDGEPVSSPVVAGDGTIYVASTDGNLYRINPDGTKYNNNWPIAVPRAEADVVGAVALAPGLDGTPDGTIYVTYDDDTKLHAIDPSGPSGRFMRWEFDVSLAGVGESPIIDSAPAVGPDGTVYFYATVFDRSIGADDAKLLAVDCGGNLKWYVSVHFNAEDHDDFQYAPVVDANGIIYAPYGFSQSLGAQAYQLVALDPANGSTKTGFPFSTGGTIHSSPAIGSDGTLYFGSDDGYFYAVNANGTQRWRYQVGSSFNGTTGSPIISSPALGADNTIYFGTNYFDNTQNPPIARGGMISIKDNLNGTSSFMWAYPATGQLGPIRSSPALGSDNAVYFGSDDNNVYAVYGSASLATSTWPMFMRNLSHTASEATSTSCSAPYWITPQNGQSISLSQCSPACVLLEVDALAGTQVEFDDADSSPPFLNSGTAGSDNTYSFNWCNPLSGTHHLYFKASSGGVVVSTEDQPITVTISGTTATFSCIDVQFSATPYDREVGPGAARSPETDYNDQWNIIAGSSGTSAYAAGFYPLFDVTGKCTPVTVDFGSAYGTFVFTQPPANGASHGLLRGGVTGEYMEPMELEIDNIPAGTYDLYLYGTGGTIDWGDGPVTWSSYFEFYYPSGPPDQYTSAQTGWDINTWVEGNQYIVFRGLQSPGGVVVNIWANNRYSYEQPLINGLQLVRTQ